MMSNGVPMWDNFDESLRVLQIRNDPFSTLPSGQADVFFGCVFVYISIRCENRELLEGVSQTNFIVVGIVRRCNLQGTCPEFCIHIHVGDYRNFSVTEG